MTELYQRRTNANEHKPHNESVKKMLLPSPPPRTKPRPPALLRKLLILTLSSVIVYCTTLGPLANKYRNLYGEEEKSIEDNDVASQNFTSQSTPLVSPPTNISTSIVAPTSTASSRSDPSSSLSSIHTSKNQNNSSIEKEAISCHLEMESYLYPKIYRWVIDKVPIAVNVKIIENQYFVIFNTGYIDPDIWYNAEYKCNDSNETATILSTTRPGRGNLIIQCPKSIEHNTDKLQTVSVLPSKNGNVTAYDMEKFLECEQLDIKRAPLSNISIGMCTSIAGKGKIRTIAHEWVEYHKLIGVDHTWIYINSDWDEGRHPERPYISWVPYNFNIKAYNFTDRPWTQRSEFFRVTSQVECVLRARRMGVDWVIFTDIDEYVSVQTDNNTEIAGDDTPALKKLLNTYYKQEKDTIGGIAMNSIPFGNNLEVEKSPEKSLMIDHVYRNKGNPKEAPWTRWKQIVNPQNVHSYAIHWLGGGDVLKEIRLDADKVRINHYKEVNKGVGVFQTTNADDLIEDRILSDKYRQPLMNALGF